ncbi:MAG: DNA repair protein RadC [Candidatus Paceibacterota bacterium]|jgi:DNA repair protein RadC|nr:DNA repair protein RadC [Candidatus Paceibacterota bacterium]
MKTLLASPYVLRDNDLFLDSDAKEYVLRVKDLPSEAKPREKMMQSGPSVLSEVELMAVILGVGTKKEEVMSMASRLFEEYGKNAIVNHTDPRKLEREMNIPASKACQIIASLELGRRFFKQANGKTAIIRTSKQAYEYLKDMGELQKEHLRGIYLNSRYRVIHEETISIGSLTANIVHPREVFRPAVEHHAVAVIIAHNHPSGDKTPTKEDRAITKQLCSAGKILGIDLLDHLVITKTGFGSIASHRD